MKILLSLFSVCLFVMTFALLVTSVDAQSGRRYQVGEIKVGDRVEADPSGINRWQKCTVLAVNIRPDINQIDTYSIHCDGTNGNGGISYQVIATDTYIHPGGAADQTANNGVQNAPGQQGRTGVTATAVKGNKYGTRDARTCDDKKAPARGAISAALATKYFICEAEGVKGSELYLVENVKTEVGGSRPFNPRDDVNYYNIDVRFPVYPIRGSFTMYQCVPVENDPKFPTYNNVGENCSRYENRNAKGSCYKTTFGDWRCTMADFNIADDDKKHRVAPPQ